MDRRIVVAGLTTLLVGITAAAQITLAQQAPGSAPPASRPGVQQSGPGSAPPASRPAETAAGMIKAVDSTGRMIVLDDGTKFVIPTDLKVSREQLKEGATVRVTYEASGGQNVVKSIQVQPSK